jgi:hypothetical protein
MKKFQADDVGSYFHQSFCHTAGGAILESIASWRTLLSATEPSNLRAAS